MGANEMDFIVCDYLLARNVELSGAVIASCGGDGALM